MTIKVAYVLEDGRFGGAQRWISAISGRLREYDLEPVVVFPAINSDRLSRQLNSKEITAKPVSLHHLTKSKRHLTKFFLFFVPEIILLYNLFKKEEVDIVVCNNSWQFKGVIAGSLANKLVIWHLHETSTPQIVNIVFRFLAAKCPDAFVTAGKCAKFYHLTGKVLTKKPIMETQAPVDTSVFEPQRVKELPQITSYPGLKIMTICNVNPLKGIEYFIKMACLLNSNNGPLSFFVIGPHFHSQKEYSKQLYRLVKRLGIDNLHFLGASDNIPSVLKSADIYVCSSTAEASPLSVWEAMSMAKPIVTSAVGDVTRFIKDGENGFVVAAGDSAALAEKVELLIKDERLRKAFGQMSRSLAVKYLDVSICAAKHAQFYRSLLNNH